MSEDELNQEIRDIYSKYSPAQTLDANGIIALLDNFAWSGSRTNEGKFVVGVDTPVYGHLVGTDTSFLMAAKRSLVRIGRERFVDSLGSRGARR